MYLVSNSGNKYGAQYLQELLGVPVHTLENVYSYMHIDSTVAFLREGLMLVNPSRVKSKDMLPKAFQDWDVIFSPEPVDIGHYPGWCNSSKWINERELIKGKFKWQEGFGAFSYAQSQLDNVIAYINNQEQHHRKKLFKDEYIELLQKYNVNYDDRYLFEWIE